MISSGSPTVGTHPGAYLLDTSVLVLSLRGNTAISSRIDGAPQVYVSSVVLGELYVGAFGSPTRQVDALADVQGIERKIAVLDVGALTAQVYGRIKQQLKTSGYTVPDNDLWIAATAIQYDLTLAARDAHFNWVTGLRVEQW
jgi:tRNA(fMet)-specific endonuclease VapC